MCLCRLCLDKSSSNFIDIFTNVSATKVSDLILKYLQINIINDEISNKICIRCWMKLSDFHEFYILVQKAQSTITIINNKIWNKDSSSINNQTITDKHLISEPDLCPDIKEEFVDVTELDECKKQTIIIQEDTATVILKNVRNNLITTDSLMPSNCSTEDIKNDNHFEEYYENCNNQNTIKTNSNPNDSVHDEDVIEDEKDSDFNEIEDNLDHSSSLPSSSSSSDSEDNDLNYSKTNKKRKKQNYKKKKVKKNSQTQMINEKKEIEAIESYYKMNCEICNEDLENFGKLLKHYTKNHCTRGFITCCGKKLFSRPNISDHIQWHKHPELFKCECSDKIFRSKQSLQNHLLRHNALYKCEKCSKKFINQSRLDEHVLIHMTPREKKFICTECEKPFATLAKLKQHERQQHENAYTQMCEICSKVFKTREFFKKHQLQHIGKDLPKVQCKICKVWRKNHHSLRFHMNIHKDAGKIHECDICGKRGPTSNAIAKHKKNVHVNEQFKCTYCDKGFKLAVALKEHMTRHTGEILYNCKYCSKTSNSHANMYVHYKKVHPNEWAEEKRIKSEYLNI